MLTLFRLIAIAVALLPAICRSEFRQAETRPAQAAPCRERPALGRWYPAEIVSNKVFVRGRIDDSKPLRFVIDTGAPSGFIDDRLVEELGFRRQRTASGTGSAGSSAVVLTRLEPPACQAAAGGILPNEVFRSLQLGEISAAEGLRVDGLVGGDFFNRYVVEIDYAHKRIRMLPPSFDYRGSGTRVPLSIRGGHIYTKAIVRNRAGATAEGTFMIDTGFRTAISFAGPFAATHHLASNAPSVRNATMGIGAGGESRATIFRLGSLQIAGLQWQNVVATASLDQAGLLARSDLAGVIGGDLLRRFRVFLDYPHHQLILERTATSDLPFDYDESGLFLVADSPGLRTIRVLRVLPASPAADAGVREDDIIASINGTSTKTIGLDGLRKLFRKDGVLYTLIVQREGISMSLTLRTRSLFELPPSRRAARDVHPSPTWSLP